MELLDTYKGLDDSDTLCSWMGSCEMTNCLLLNEEVEDTVEVELDRATLTVLSLCVDTAVLACILGEIGCRINDWYLFSTAVISDKFLLSCSPYHISRFYLEKKTKIETFNLRTLLKMESECSI